MAITFSLSFVVLLFCTGNVILSVLSIVTIAGIVTSVLGIGCRLIQVRRVCRRVPSAWRPSLHRPARGCLGWTLDTPHSRLTGYVRQGWSLDIPESVAGVILIGFSVDYCVHLAHAYMESSSTLRQERIQDAVTCMGISITAGAATTFMAGVFLFGAVRGPLNTRRSPSEHCVREWSPETCAAGGDPPELSWKETCSPHFTPCRH